MGTLRIRREDGEFTLFFRKVSPFSNHHPADFDCDGAINSTEMKRFSCTEQYYMFNKASLLMDRQLMKSVLDSVSPREMKTMCSKGALKGWSDSVWNEHKESVMYTGCTAKFRALRHLRFALFLSTGSRLVECSPFDTVWGIGKDIETAVSGAINTGKNLLGTILDRVREELWQDPEFRDEKEYVEKRIREDGDYLLQAMKHVDLMYKARAKMRFQILKGREPRDVEYYLTSEVRGLLPEWAFPPRLDGTERIEPSPAQFTHFRDDYGSIPINSVSFGARTRSVTPPFRNRRGSRLFGRLTRTEQVPIFHVYQESEQCEQKTSMSKFWELVEKSHTEQKQRQTSEATQQTPTRQGTEGVGPAPEAAENVRGDLNQKRKGDGKRGVVAAHRPQKKTVRGVIKVPHSL
ncbi:unnamed protein product [Caenorhabditis sp. 36 PRJEB53466]|nr:unnamed protein product [Caenorhabditis sp. 36 PRJEB53466]